MKFCSLLSMPCKMDEILHNFHCDSYWNLAVKFEKNLNSTFWRRANFILFHLIHEWNLLLCINVALTELNILKKIIKIFESFLNFLICWLCPGGTVVEHSTQSPTIAGLNPATGTGRKKVAPKAFLFAALFDRWWSEGLSLWQRFWKVCRDKKKLFHSSQKTWKGSNEKVQN